MDIVSFETAAKLKAAGFPQPEPKRGQAWYRQCWEQYQDDSIPQKMVWHPYWLTNDMLWTDGGIFAPTATDILTLLDSTRFYFDRLQKIWYADAYRYNTADEFKHENPAEAAAMAWMARYCKPIKIPVHTITCMTDSSLSIGGE